MSSKRAYYNMKLSTNYLSNVKFIRLPDATKWHYVGLYLLSIECDSGGLLIQNDEILNVEDLSLLLHVDFDDLSKSIELLIQSGFLLNDDGFIISVFLDEQGNMGFGFEAENKRAEWRKRQQAKRQRDKQKDIDKLIDSDKDLNIDKESDIDSDKDIDIDIDICRHANVTRDINVTSCDIKNDNFSLVANKEQIPAKDTKETNTFSLATINDFDLNQIIKFIENSDFEEELIPAVEKYGYEYFDKKIKAKQPSDRYEAARRLSLAKEKIEMPF